jgi:hypothetical protein
MDVSSQLRAPHAFIPGTESPLSTEHERLCFPEPVLTPWITERPQDEIWITFPSSYVYVFILKFPEYGLGPVLSQTNSTHTAYVVL